VKLVTSLRRDEVDKIDSLGVRLGNDRYRRAGTLRAMLRFALANEEQFVKEFKEQEGKPIEGGA